MNEPDIIVVVHDDLRELEYYSLLLSPILERAPHRVELHTFSSDDEAVRFVAQKRERIVGYIQNLLRSRDSDDGPLEGVVFIREVIKKLTPAARVIVRSAVPEMAEDLARSDPNIRLLSKYASDARLMELIEWLILPPASPAESSSGLIHSVAPLIQVVSTPWPEIRRRISMNPDELHRLPPRTFEKLIAEVYRDYGWEVDLTATTRDGGYDIIAVRRNAPGELKVLIEAKRYDPTNKVGVGIVRSLYGVRQVRHASQVVLATSSYVSDDAKREFQHVIPHELGIMERDEILEWCRRAGQVTLTGFAE